MKKFLLFGGNGLIGKKLIKKINSFKNYSCFNIDKNKLDLLLDSNMKLINMKLINKKLINNEFKGIIVCPSLV